MERMLFNSGVLVHVWMSSNGTLCKFWGRFVGCFRSLFFINDIRDAVRSWASGSDACSGGHLVVA